MEVYSTKEWRTQLSLESLISEMRRSRNARSLRPFNIGETAHLIETPLIGAAFKKTNDRYFSR
jgi:hypothetical protein